MTGSIWYIGPMIITEGFRANENQMELLPDVSGAFPCLCKFVDLREYIGNSVPWHWHHSFEINYCCRGSVTTMITDQQASLRQGEAVFVNSNTLHSAPPPAEGEDCQYYTIFFDTEFISGGYNNVFSQKYILPITSCRDLQFFPIRSDSPEGIRLLGILVDIIDLFREEPFGYEFLIRSRLSDFWLLLFTLTEDIRKNSGSSNATDEIRMKQMMQYIESHFGEKILLEDIADAAGISSRECSRCFARTVKLSPIDYLNRYRVRMAAGRIVNTGDPIGRIAEACGFASDSYFGKMFRSVMGVSPRDYRKLAKED